LRSLEGATGQGKEDTLGTQINVERWYKAPLRSLEIALVTVQAAVREWIDTNLGLPVRTTTEPTADLHRAHG